ncbi:hypothetical protein Prudu_517S000100, partial [Prunus dulcis]
MGDGEVSAGTGDNEKYLAALLAQKIQLIDLKKLISKQLRLLRPSRADSQKHGLPMVENASTMINQGEDRSLFLMVTFLRGKYTDAIYEVKFKFGGEVDDMGAQVARVAKFSGSTHLGARLFDRSQLYVFSEEGWDKPCVDSFGGYIFDTKTRALDRLTPSTVQFKQHGKVVSAYGTLYFLETETEFVQGSGLFFGKYNPNKKDWVQMPSFPFSYNFTMWVTGYALVMALFCIHCLTCMETLMSLLFTWVERIGNKLNLALVLRSKGEPWL